MVASIPKPVEAMSEDERRDFMNEMYVAVHEEAPLYVVPLGSRDWHPTGDVVHGPWRAEDCSGVLLRWHDLGLLLLYRYNEDGSNGPDLEEADAADILSDTSRWVRPLTHADVVALCVTERGLIVGTEEWLKVGRSTDA